MANGGGGSDLEGESMLCEAEALVATPHSNVLRKTAAPTMSPHHLLLHNSKKTTDALAGQQEGGNLTADDCPMLRAGNIGGNWSVTHSSVTLLDLQQELEMAQEKKSQVLCRANMQKR